MFPNISLSVRPQSVKILRKEAFLKEGTKVQVVCEVGDTVFLPTVVMKKNTLIGKPSKKKKKVENFLMGLEGRWGHIRDFPPFFYFDGLP